MQWVEELDLTMAPGYYQWLPRRRLEIQLSTALNPAKLAASVPQLGLREVRQDVWEMNYLEIEELLLDHLVVPPDHMKDASWISGAYLLLFEFVDLPRFASALEATFILLDKDDDWDGKVYTIRGLSALIGQRLATASATVLARFTLVSSDFISLARWNFNMMDYSMGESERMNFLVRSNLRERLSGLC